MHKLTVRYEATVLPPMGKRIASRRFHRRPFVII